MKTDDDSYKREIARVREIQASLLPDFKNLAGFDIDSTFLPASDISGDFFDGFYISSDIYQIILCDVSGHGMASAYVGNEIRTIFRLYSLPERPMEETVGLVNGILIRELGALYYFCTAIICRIDTTTGVISYLNAGHPPAIIYRAGSGENVILEDSGALIGLFESDEYHTEELVLDPGDYLLFYTDGITEAMDLELMSDKGIFGLDRIVCSVRENAGATSRDMLLSLVSSVYEFTDFSEQLDDMTAICLRKL